MTDVVEARRALNRAAVVRAAADLADVHGLDALTLTRVAETLGVSLPALYNHVRSSSDCTAAIAQDGLDALTERLDTARGTAVRDEAVRAVGSAWRCFAAERPGLYSAIHRHRWSRSPEQAAAGDRLLALLRSVVLTYGDSTGGAADRAWALGAALHGFVASEAEGAAPAAADLDRAFSRLLDLLCEGLRAAPFPAPTTR
ncbi:MAG: TetR/AcrR family transcriptional regulator [Frankiales bacterium]|nr:MAG: TetR/AcrR family transcriptional regulator [Frankiales bacterium]